MSVRSYHDPLHKAINLDSRLPEEKVIIRLIDTEPFQRLRRIKQLGPAYLTFHGAESSRFTHSLGVFYIARKAFNNLLKFDPSLEEYRGILYFAALLHDIGHGPLSHTGEEIFGVNHETWSAKLIQNDVSIKNCLDSFAIGTSETVANLLSKTNTHSKAIKALISSQLDCDRLDYLLRDSYATGTSYGRLDLDRILSALILAPDGDLAIHPKGLMAVEHYLVVRDLMYRSVYNHRINEVCNWLLSTLIKVARELGPSVVWTDNYMKKWLWEPNKIDLETFLGNDDIRMGYHLLHWKETGPQPLAELCERFLNRRLLKAISVDHLDRCLQLELLSKARRLTESINQNPDTSCGLRPQNFQSYQPYKSGLRLWDGYELKALEQTSSLVNSLSKPNKKSWLIYPREIDESITNELKMIPKIN